MSRLGISLLTYNFWEYTDRCLDSLIRGLKYPGNLVILDDASTDGTQLKLVEKRVASWCPAIMSVKYIFEKENIGLIKGRNKTFEPLLQDPGVEYILIIHNDHIITEGMIDGLLEVFEAEPKAGIVGADIFQGGDPPEIRELEEKARGHYKREWFRGNCHPALMKASALREALMSDGKVYDESWAEAKAECEDIDLLGRLEDAGYKTLVTKTAWAHHIGELTRSNHPDTQKRKNFARTMYEKKWAQLGKMPWDHRKGVNYSGW